MKWLKVLFVIPLLGILFSLAVLTRPTQARPLGEAAVTLEIESISGPDEEGAYHIKGSATPTDLRPDPKASFSNYLSVYAEFMGAGGQWPVFYEFRSIGWSCNAIGDRCVTEEEDHGINVQSAGLVSVGLEYEDDGKPVPFDATVKIPEGAQQMRIIARLKHTLHGNPWDAIFFRWAEHGPIAVTEITPQPPEADATTPSQDSGQTEQTTQTTPGAPTETAPALPIVLRASKDGYGEASRTIVNSYNFEVVIIEGVVTDQEGNGVADANVEVVSGADPAAISTNPDGSYSLVIYIPGGQGNGSLGGVNFTLQLEGDLSISKIELLQAVSGAELADSKHTAALVFPHFSSQAQSSVDTQVTLYVNGQLFKTLPFRVKSEYTADDHRKVSDAVKFLIPPSFVRTGVFEVRAVIDPGNTFVEPDENNNEKTWSQMVSPSRGLSILMVALSPNISSGAAQSWASTARKFLANTFPVPAVRIVQHPVYSNGWLNMVMALRDAAIVDNARVAFNAAQPGSRVEYAAGLYPPNSYGTGNRGFVYRFLYPQAPLVSIEFPITIAHEIGHVYLGGHEEVDDDPNLGGVALPEGYVYDFLTGRVRYIKPNSNWINFMGDPYAGFELGSVTVKPWVSPSASNTILGVRQSAAHSQTKVTALIVPNWFATEPFDQVLYLSGYFDGDELKVLPPQILNSNLAGDYPAGEFTASMQAADGSVLASATFEINTDIGEYGAPNPGAFQVEIPYPAATARLVITRNGQEFYRLEKSANPPNVNLDQPGGGNPVNQETTVTWSASDGDGDSLTYNVYYSPDGGASWQLIGLGWTDQNLLVDGSLLPGSDDAMIRVVASDGLNIGQADSPPFVVPKHAPTVTIQLSDPDAEPWVTGHPNLLAAIADDIEDGWLPSEALQWSSDKDGVIGQGNAIYVALSKGEHTITITATDQDGQQASDTILVTVAEPKSSLTYIFPGGLLSEGMLYLLCGGACLFMIMVIFVSVGIVFIRRRRTAPAQASASMTQDAQGRWWSQDPNTGTWYLWDGRVWQPVQTPPQRVYAPGKPPRSGSGGTISCLGALGILGLLVVVVGGGVALVMLGFIPEWQPAAAASPEFKDLLLTGGGGLLLSLFGVLMVRGGIKSILTRRAIIEDDETGYRREVRGCSAIINGVMTLLFGLLLSAGGIGLLSVTFFQFILPWFFSAK